MSVVPGTGASTGPAPQPDPVVPADGSPASADGDQVVGDRLATRLGRWRALLLALAVLLVVTVATMGLRTPGSDIPLAVDNHKHDGARALARVLAGYGVSVASMGSVDDAAAAGAQGATVVVVNAGALTDTQRRTLAGTGGDVVVLGTLYQDLDGLADALTSTGTSAAATTTLTPQCTDPDARAAAALSGSRGSVTIDTTAAPGATGCFPVSGGTYAYAVAPLDGGGTLRVVADATIAQNQNLTTAGNAALLIRAMGHHEQVVWLDGKHLASGSFFQSGMVPPWLPVLLLQLILAAGVLAVVDGRRFGRIVTEPLPVVVRAVETTVGRGRLYRSAKARGHAAQALRAGSALRLARRLGLPAGAGRDHLVHAVSAATSLPPEVIDRTLYGPPPTTDQRLADLAHQLDQLESEVHT